MPKASKKSEESSASMVKAENCQKDGTARAAKAAKFTEETSLQIVELYLQHEPYLSGKYYKQTAPGKRKQIWEDIASTVNTSSTVKRTWEQVRKRLYDVKKAVRHKRLRAQKDASCTGSLSLDISFKPSEVRLSSFINSASLHEVGGTDSTALEEFAGTVPALTKTQAKKDGGFANNWSFEQTEDGEVDAERDEANLLSVDDGDGVNSSFEEPKSKQLRQEAARGDSLKTYEKRAKCLNLRNLKGNAIGLNMLGTSKKIGDNTQNISASPGTVLHGRRFHHANSQMPAVKTAAQSSLDRKERKEYPPHIQKVDDDHIRLPRTHILENDVDSKEEQDVDSGCEIKRRVLQKRRCESYAGALSSSPALKTGFNRLDVGQKKYVSEQIECMSRCPGCGKENGSQTKCQNCANLQRHSRQSITFNELSGPLPRPAIHQNSAVHKSFTVGFNAKNFYSPNFANVPVDILLNHELGRSLLPTNGKVGLSDDLHKHARTIKLRGIRSSEMNDPIVLSSDEEDDDSSTGSTRVESTSPRPADSACSSPAPSTGKVEAAFKENTSKVEQRLNSSIAADTECTVALPRKARMKDQYGNAVASIPVKRRKVAQQETVPKSICDSFLVNSSHIMIGSLIRDLADPVVIFGLDEVCIKLQQFARGVHEIRLRTSELSKCDWCNAPKLPLICLQTVPAASLSLRSKLNMSREKSNKWYDCKSRNAGEQFIVLFFTKSLEKEESTMFEKLIGDIGIQNKIPDFLTIMNYDDAHSRICAISAGDREFCLKQNMSQKDNKTKNMAPDSRKLRSSASPLKFFDDEDESGESHSVFIGPIVKLIVYPPPPAKGGISVTNEDLHCLNEGEFLNDVIIDFYLKYLVLEKLRKDADRIHMFSSFFYKRLNQRERRNLQETANLSLQQRRHGRVKTWTRHVDIFQKDFIFVPLNEAAHWFLAVICFPGLTKPEYEPNPLYQGPVDTLVCTTEEDNGVSSQVESSAVEAPLPKQTAKKTPCKKQITVPGEGSCGNEECDTPRTRKSPCRGKRALRNESEENCEADTRQSPSKVDEMSKGEICNQNENKTSVKATDALDSLRQSYSDDPGDISKTNDDQFIDFSEDQDNLDESSDDGTMADEAFLSDSMKWHLKALNCKQPCILLMDSLRGPSRSNVVRTLREYLEVEWEVRKGSKRSFSKEHMKGSNPRVPQQNNFSDCGVYILQYVESFFENPIQSFDLPMNLTDWFPEERMKTKREEIRNLILNLQELQNKDKKGQKDLGSITPPATPQEERDELIPHDSTH